MRGIGRVIAVAALAIALMACGGGRELPNQVSGGADIPYPSPLPTAVPGGDVLDP
jgi:hypothetical protein